MHRVNFYFVWTKPPIPDHCTTQQYNQTWDICIMIKKMQNGNNYFTFAVPKSVGVHAAVVCTIRLVCSGMRSNINMRACEEFQRGYILEKRQLKCASLYYYCGSMQTRGLPVLVCMVHMTNKHHYYNRLLLSCQMALVLLEKIKMKVIII